MKKILLFVLILLSFPTFSQDNYVSINMGGAFPLGNLVMTESLKNNGYATSGFNLSVEGAYYKQMKLGISGAIKFSTIGVDAEAVEQDLLAYVENHSSLYGDIDANSDPSCDVELWNIVNVMVGPVLAIPTGKFQFELKGQGGVSFLMPAQYNASIKTEDMTVKSNTESQVVKLGYLFGANIIYNFSNVTSLKISGEYFHSKSDHILNFTNAEDEDQIVIDEIKSDLKIDNLNLTIGLAYLF